MNNNIPQLPLRSDLSKGLDSMDLHGMGFPDPYPRTPAEETKLDSVGGDQFGNRLGKFNWTGVPAEGASGGLETQQSIFWRSLIGIACGWQRHLELFTGQGRCVACMQNRTHVLSIIIIRSLKIPLRLTIFSGSVTPLRQISASSFYGRGGDRWKATSTTLYEDSEALDTMGLF
ncbi:hypothetical protein SUGI_1204380 [Cryptomeria japonica]|nr:hypothetical protein SUGI_1204380 [Cryptomeria japonica]